MKKLLTCLLALALFFALAACSDPEIGGESGANEPASRPDAVITLSGDGASYDGGGVAIDGSVVTIGAPGEFTLRGTLNDGRILVDLKENPGKLVLILDGVDLCCLTDSAIFVAQGEVELVLAAGSENRVVSGTEAQLAAYDETSTGAAVYASDDLTLRGEGSLDVFGYINNGVACKDDLKIKGGSIRVTAANNAVRASESVTVSGGALTLDAGNDGLKASSAKKEGKGFVLIEDGSLAIRAGGDGVSAASELTVSGGTVSVETSGDPALHSCKGMKAETGLTISGGTVSVLAQDHAIRSAAALTVTGGMVAAKSLKGKGMSAEQALLIEAGTLQLSALDDGLVSGVEVTIRGGEVTVFAGADGIQGGKKGTGFQSETGTVRIEGGRVLVSAGNKAVDAKAQFTVAGGTVFAAGSKLSLPAGEQPYLLGQLAGQAGDTLSVSGQELQAAYAYATVFFTDEALREGESYTLSAGGQSRALTATR